MMGSVHNWVWAGCGLQSMTRVWDVTNIGGRHCTAHPGKMFHLLSCKKQLNPCSSSDSTSWFISLHLTGTFLWLQLSSCSSSSTTAVHLVSLPSLVSATSEQEEAGDVLKLFEMWKYYAHSAEEKSNLKCIKEYKSLSVRAGPCRMYSEAGDLITRNSATWL